jgi:CHAD domain-containing protein
MTDDSKWIVGVTARQPVAEVAYIALQSRMQAVWRWLPLAAERNAEDGEFVHQLRVACRRAEATLRSFSDLLPKPVSRLIRRRLRMVRRAAGAVRDGDVLLSRAAELRAPSGQAIPETLAALLKASRDKAQEELAAVYLRLQREGLADKLAWLLDVVFRESATQRRGNFGPFARQSLRHEALRFRRAARNALRSNARLHRFRIAGKRLRYTIEVVAPAFDSALRHDIYPLLSDLQERLGRLNDCAAAADWLVDACHHGYPETEQPAARQLAAAHQESLLAERKRFRQWWTSKRARGLWRALAKRSR